MQALFSFICKEAPTLVDLFDCATLSQQTPENRRYAPENRSSPRVVTAKWLLTNEN